MKLKQFTPVGDRVVFKPHKPRQLHAGLVLPDDTMLFSPTGTVVAVGPDCKQIKEGDVVAVDPGLVLNLLHLPYSATDKHLFCCCAEDKIHVVLDPDAYAAQVDEDSYMNEPATKGGRR